ncbi:MULTISPECIES: DMT family transporter [Chryseobacterium]|uniref:EamA/RhaT family transporter n=1 Tax=Chryseobacterium bernardetii TaxID=1241978 RepID=A0A3G6U1C1_9FLAO|nr:MULTISPECIES: EamA family transporter [Chryseobacterium]AZB24707.1 EamA/RhaT family transporter [Chryseobacterium bernardetii]AZB35288.1 EamA/RhaT family transporter [Chryseobacterium bernardetii]UCA59155.1 DMT family transporter [Chryseobacterium rhizoplanae]
MHKLALFRLHLIVFLWGFTAILGKLIHANAQILVFYRMLFAAIFLFIFIRIYKKESIRVSKKIFFQLAAIGFTMALHWYCFFYSIKVSNVSIALSCLSLSTLFASILEPIIFKRKIDISEVVMGVVIVACILLIFKTEFQYKEGIIYGVLCAVFGTIFSVFNGKMFGKTSSGNIIFYEIFCGWFILMLFYLFSGQIFQMNEINYRDIALICLLASVFTAFPMLESVSLMKYISPFTLILTVNLEPVYGIILAFFIFGESEHMSPIFYIASGVMILAIIANGLIKARKTKNFN